MSNDESAASALYKTLIIGELVPLSGFSTGGNTPHARVDAPLARNGAGELVIRGTALAGALIALARRLCDDESLIGRISAGPPSEQVERRRAQHEGRDVERLPESLWRFHNAHPIGGEPGLEVRSGVGIRQDTGAAETGLKFETEIVPAGTRWGFLMEIDDYRERGTRARALALHALGEWEGGHCFLGRDPARGLGWMRLVDTRIRVLAPRDATRWPDAGLGPREAFDALADVALLDEDARGQAESVLPMRRRRVLTGTGTIQVGTEDADPWGLDTLSVGGSESMRAMQEGQLDRHAMGLPERRDPNGRPMRPEESESDPDLVLAWTRPADAPNARLRPVIPGSSLRGPLRHGLSWWLRRRGETIADPNATRGAPGATDVVALLFGNVERSAALLLSDALPDEQDVPVVFMEHHAEDEFSAGAAGPMKFNRLCLASGRFQFHFHLEAPDSETDTAGDHDAFEHLKALLEDLAALGAAHQVPLGGGQWRGHGWVCWTWNLDAGDRG